MNTLLLRLLLSALVARATRLPISDVELVMADLAKLIRNGVVCSIGRDGEYKGEPVCCPADWDEADEAWHAAACARCPVYRHHALEAKNP